MCSQTKMFSINLIQIMTYRQQKQGDLLLVCAQFTNSQALRQKSILFSQREQIIIVTRSRSSVLPNCVPQERTSVQRWLGGPLGISCHRPHQKKETRWLADGCKWTVMQRPYLRPGPIIISLGGARLCPRVGGTVQPEQLSLVTKCQIRCDLNVIVSALAGNSRYMPCR